MNFKAAIFDLDGTLLDTVEDIAVSMNHILENAGYPIHNNELYKQFIGNGMRNLVQRSLPKDKQDYGNTEQCYTAMKTEYSKRWAKKTKPYPGITETLKALTERGLKLAVLSNKPDEFTKTMIKHLLPSSTFEVVYGERPHIPKKPDPTSALEITKILGVKAEECLFLGDSGVDMQTATSAGMYAVGVLWGFRKAEELLEYGAKTLVSNPAAILDLLQNNSDFPLN